MGAAALDISSRFPPSLLNPLLTPDTTHRLSNRIYQIQVRTARLRTAAYSQDVPPVHSHCRVPIQRTCTAHCPLSGNLCKRRLTRQPADNKYNTCTCTSFQLTVAQPCTCLARVKLDPHGGWQLDCGPSINHHSIGRYARRKLASTSTMEAPTRTEIGAEEDRRTYSTSAKVESNYQPTNERTLLAGVKSRICELL